MLGGADFRHPTEHEEDHENALERELREEYEETLRHMGPVNQATCGSVRVPQGSSKGSDRLARICLLEDTCSAGVDAIPSAVKLLREAKEAHPDEVLFGSEDDSEWETLRRFFFTEDVSSPLEIAKAVAASDHRREMGVCPSASVEPNSSDDDECDLADITHGLSLDEHGHVVGEELEGVCGTRGDPLTFPQFDEELRPMESMDEDNTAGTVESMGDDGGAQDLPDADNGGAINGDHPEWEAPWHAAVVVDPEGGGGDTPGMVVAIEDDLSRLLRLDDRVHHPRLSSQPLWAPWAAQDCAQEELRLEDHGEESNAADVECGQMADIETDADWISDVVTAGIEPGEIDGMAFADACAELFNPSH